MSNKEVTKSSDFIKSGYNIGVMASASLAAPPPIFIPKELAKEANAPKFAELVLDSGTKVTLHL